MTDRRPMWAPDVLDGVTAIVTGASRGIGRAITAAYVDAGARVVLVSRSQSSLDEACAAIDRQGSVCSRSALTLARTARAAMS